jgi:hypothetical protein
LQLIINLLKRCFMKTQFMFPLTPKTRAFGPLVRVHALQFFTLTLMMIAMLSSGYTTAQTYETDGLEIDFTEGYTKIWTDAGSGADKNFSIWRPVPQKGWYIVGDHAKGGWAYPTGKTMVIKEKKPGSGLLVSPTTYELIWKDAGSGADKNVVVWCPVCPTGYKALGHVATNGVIPRLSPHISLMNKLKCVKQSELEKALPGGDIWKDKGSGADRDFACWGIQAPGADASSTYLSRGLFYGAKDSHARPTPAVAKVLWSIKMKKKDDDLANMALMSDELFFDYTQVFKKIWNDKGSGADRNVSFFKPIPRPGYHVLGHFVHNSHSSPSDAVMIVVKEKKRGALKKPLTYQRVWTDAGSGADRNVAIWRPKCPSGYVALGLLATAPRTMPTVEDCRCVRSDLTAQAAVGNSIWNDKGSGADSDFGSWEVNTNNAPPGSAYVSPGTFIGHASHKKPNGQGARALIMKLPEIKATQKLAHPQLFSFDRPSPFEENTVTSTVYLPFTVIDEPDMSQAKQAKDSPYYKLIRTDRYTLIQHLYNDDASPQSTSWEYSTAIKNETSMTHSAGLKFTKSWGSEVDGGVAKTSSSFSVELSYSFTYASSRSTTATTTVKVPIVAEGHSAIAAYNINSTYRLFRTDGTPVGGEVTANQPGSTYITSYKESDEEEVVSTTTTSTNNDGPAVASTAPATSSYDNVTIISGTANQVLDLNVGDGSISRNASHGGNNQQWSFVPVAGEYYKIVSKSSQKVFDINRGNGIVSTYNYHGGDNQLWKIESKPNGRCQIISKWNNRVLDTTDSKLKAVVSDGSTKAGQLLQID